MLVFSTQIEYGRPQETAEEDMHSIRFLVNCYEILTNFLLVAAIAGCHTAVASSLLIYSSHCRIWLCCCCCRRQLPMLHPMKKSFLRLYIFVLCYTRARHIIIIIHIVFFCCCYCCIDAHACDVCKFPQLRLTEWFLLL